MMGEATVVIHEAIAPISDEEVATALSPETFGPRTRVTRLRGPRFELEGLEDLDWPAVHDSLVRDIDENLAPALRESSGPVYHFGMLPIPLAIEVGRRIGPARRILAHQQRHDSKSWRWPSEDLTVSASLLGGPNGICNAKGDVIIRVSCSHPVEAEDARRAVPEAIGEMHVKAEAPSEDLLRSEADVTLVASLFGEALDCVRRFYPNCRMVHVFAAVPPALALRLGAEINPTIHTPVQTYQFSGRRSPRYTRALVAGERPRPGLSAEAVAAAAVARNAFAAALQQVRLVCVPPAPLARWLTDLVGPAGEALPRAFWSLGPLQENIMITASTVAMEMREADGEFRWDPEKRAWIFDDRLLSSLAARLGRPALEQAARLFLLHETIHATRQGLTSATAERVGRLPRVLEEADYLADLWAIVHEYGRAVRARETDADGAAEFIRGLLRLMTTTFWAFDAGDFPLRTVQVRRLNRYLIWYWQRLALESAVTISDAVQVLAVKPVLEISGPRITTARGRVAFELESNQFDSIELGVLVDGYRIERVGTRAGAQVGSLLDSLRSGDEDRFVRSLRGIFDSVSATRRS
jgi:hypothetical protein